MKGAIRWLRFLVLPLLIGAFPAAAVGQDFPARTVRLMVPFPPGGAADLLARLLAQSLSDSMGQQFIVENRPGGNTIIAASVVAKSPADGYTMLMVVDSTLTMNQNLYSKLPYDPVKDFAPATLLAEQPLLLAANPTAPFKNLKELVDYAKANPGTVNIGIGALVSRVAAELLKQTTGANLTIVPYSGSAPSRTAVLPATCTRLSATWRRPRPFYATGHARDRHNGVDPGAEGRANREGGSSELRGQILVCPRRAGRNAASGRGEAQRRVREGAGAACDQIPPRGVRSGNHPEHAGGAFRPGEDRNRKVGQAHQGDGAAPRVAMAWPPVRARGRIFNSQRLWIK